MLSAQEKLQTARSRLATEIQKPFYYGIVYRRPLIVADPPVVTALVDGKIARASVPTAAIDAKGQMYWNEKWVDTLSIDECVFVMAHEAMHYMLRHPLRRGERDGREWNVAGDKVINDMLIADNVGKAPECGVFMDGARAYTADQLYVDPEENGGEGSGCVGQLGDLEGDILEIPMTPEEEAEAEAEAKLEVINAEKLMKLRGFEPQPEMQRLIDQIKVKPVPWHEILQNEMSFLVKADQSWSRPNKKYRHMGLYLPITDEEPVLGTVVIAFDTSGSISLKEGEMFAAHCNTIFERLPPQEVHLLFIDSSLAHVDTYTHDELPITVDKMHGGGGTSFKPAFDYIRKKLSDDIECLLYFTDLWGDQDDIAPPPYPVFWGATELRNVDFGTIVPIE